MCLGLVPQNWLNLPLKHYNPYVFLFKVDIAGILLRQRQIDID